MADGTSIQWTDATWNPVRGCTRVSEGCRHCYAESVAGRFSSKGMPYHGLAEIVERPDGSKEARWTGVVRALTGDTLTQPLRWKRPRRIFVNSMSDLFHESLPDEAIDRVFAVMALAPQHTFQVLTKRPERMRDYFQGDRGEAVWQAQFTVRPATGHHAFDWPLPNVWLGVSCEDQATAGERIPLLLQTLAAVRFISAEPLLAPIDLLSVLPPHGWQTRPGDVRSLDWVIVGGESGRGARPFDLAWAGQLVRQCAAAGVPCFVKQLGASPISSDHRFETEDHKGGDWDEWPERLRVRQYPTAASA